MDWPLFRQVERQARRLHEMMEKLGVDGGKLARLRQGEAYAEARTNCLNCLESRECLHWLDAQSSRTPGFCPNLELLDSCKKLKL